MSQLAKEVALPTTAEISAVISRQIPPAESPEQRRSDQRDSLFERFAWLYIFCRERLFRDDTKRIMVALWPDGSPRRKSRLIELGCGPGFYSCRLAARFPQLSVLGVDSSEKQLNCAREKARAQDLANCSFARVNVLALSYDAESFDHLIASRLLTILPAREKVVSEMFRILCPGGKCFVAEPRYSFWASLPLFAMWMLAGVTRYENGYREPRKASVLSQAAFKRLFATQPWKDVRTGRMGDINTHSARRGRITALELGNLQIVQRRVVDPKLSPRVRAGCCALAVMTKAPRAGKVKTRLIPPLTAEEAADLNRCFLRDITASIEQATENTNALGVAVYTPRGAEDAYHGILPDDFFLVPQRGEAFGERLLLAGEDLFRLGFESVCLINSDSPTVPPNVFIEAAQALENPGDRVVLGPSDDGGYYLIGLKKVHRRMFEEIDWSKEKVLQQTIDRAAELHLNVHLLPEWFDVDDHATLQRLCKSLLESAESGAPATKNFLENLVAREGRKRIWPNE